MMEGCSVLRFQTDFCFSANASQHLSPNNLSARFKILDKVEMAALHFCLFPLLKYSTGSCKRQVVRKKGEERNLSLHSNDTVL